LLMEKTDLLNLSPTMHQNVLMKFSFPHRQKLFDFHIQTDYTLYTLNLGGKSVTYRRKT